MKAKRFMRRGILAVFVFAFVVNSAALGQRRGEVQAARHGWLSSFEEGKAQAKKTGKPLMVVIRCVP